MKKHSIFLMLILATNILSNCPIPQMVKVNTQSAWAYIGELAKNNPILAAALATGMIATVAILSCKRSR